jgi:hypothetical protein
MLAPEWGYCPGAETVLGDESGDECICPTRRGSAPPVQAVAPADVERAGAEAEAQAANAAAVSARLVARGPARPVLTSRFRAGELIRAGFADRPTPRRRPG